MITTENQYNRRKFLTRSMGFVGAATLLAGCQSESGSATTEEEVVSGNTTLEQYKGYTNAYEFGTSKSDPAKYEDTLVTEGWQVDFDGKSMDIDTLRGMPFGDLESEWFDFRCVERWGMRVNYNGYPLSKLIEEYGDPSKKYVSFTCVEQNNLPGQGGFSSFNWPYTEALTMEEAMHPLTWAVYGNYGTPSKANGAPFRINVPWKYGFKSPKFIVKVECVDDKPPATWNRISQREYGWYSNVYPEISHPRWSQEKHRLILESGTQNVSTLPYNGYADQVEHLYPGERYDYR